MNTNEKRYITYQEKIWRKHPGSPDIHGKLENNEWEFPSMPWIFIAHYPYGCTII